MRTLSELLKKRLIDYERGLNDDLENRHHRYYQGRKYSTYCNILDNIQVIRDIRKCILFLKTENAE